LHPIQYLLCFNHIIGVSGPPFSANFLEKFGVGHRSPTKTSGGQLFVIFMRKCTKMGTRAGGGRTSFFTLFPAPVPQGLPWEPKATKMEPKATKMEPKGAQSHQNGAQGCQNHLQNKKFGNIKRWFGNQKNVSKKSVTLFHQPPQ